MASQFEGLDEITRHLRDMLDDDVPVTGLEDFVVELYVASLSTEEGHIASASVVLIPNPARIQWPDPNYEWSVYWFAELRPLDQLRKLAHVSRPGDLYLVATESPHGGGLSLCGLATPPRNYPSRGLSSLVDHHDPTASRAPEFLRASIRGPGHIVFEHGSQEILRCRRGRVIAPPPPLLELFGDCPTPSVLKSGEGHYRFILRRLVRALAQTDRGGLILIRGTAASADTDASADGGISRRIRLLTRSTYGLLDPRVTNELSLLDLFEEAECYRRQLEEAESRQPPANVDNDEVARIEDAVSSADARLSAAISATARMAAADGAVLLWSCFVVEALGAVLPVDASVQRRLADDAIYEKTAECSSDQCSHVDDCLQVFSLEERGTKHQAAAAFVLDDCTALSIVVSHDGDAAVFLRWSGHLVYWRVQVRPEWSDRGVNDMI